MKHIRRTLFLAFALVLLICSQAHAHGKNHHPVSTAGQTAGLAIDSAKVPAPMSAAQHALMLHPESHDHEAEGGVLDALAESHAALVHFPIAWVLLLFLWEVWTLGRGRELQAMGQPLALLAALSFLPTALTGLLHASMLNAAAPLQELLDTHRLLAILSGLLMVVAAGLRFHAQRRPSRAFRTAYLLTLTATLLLVLFAGHMGGQIVRSDDLLP